MRGFCPSPDEQRTSELLLGSYRLIYRIEPEAVFVVALVHGARDLAALWDRRQRPDRSS